MWSLTEEGLSVLQKRGHRPGPHPSRRSAGQARGTEVGKHGENRHGGGSASGNCPVSSDGQGDARRLWTGLSLLRGCFLPL